MKKGEKPGKRREKWRPPPPAPKDSPAVVARKQALRERRARAVEMAARGATWAMIAEALGYEGANRAHGDVQRAYREAVVPNVELMRQEAYEKLQRMYAQVAVPVGAEKSGVDPKTGEKFQTADDKALDVQRIGLARQLLRDVRELFGLDAPKKVQVAGALVTLTAAEAARMTTADLEYVAENGRLPPAPQERAPLRLVAGGEAKSSLGEGSNGMAKSSPGEGTSDDE